MAKGRGSVHGHVLCQKNTGPELFFGDLPGIDKGMIMAFVDACRVTGMPSIADAVARNPIGS